MEPKNEPGHPFSIQISSDEFQVKSLFLLCPYSGFRIVSIARLSVLITRAHYPTFQYKKYTDNICTDCALSEMYTHIIMLNSGISAHKQSIFMIRTHKFPKQMSRVLYVNITTLTSNLS